MNPAFVIYTGPMFGSKTTRLLADVDRLLHKKMNVLAFKPNVDQRYSEEKIVSHSGGSIPAICIEDADQIFDYLEDTEKDIDVIAVDEAFMIPHIDEALIDLYLSGYSIIVSSIQLDTGEKPFESIRNIMPFATKIEVCPAVCTKCNEDAYFTFPLFDIENATQEEKIGGKEMYEPRCLTHSRKDIFEEEL